MAVDSGPNEGDSEDSFPTWRVWRGGGEDERELRRGRLAFYQEDIERITSSLETYRAAARAQCCALIDVEGHPVARAGESETVNLETLSALVAASFAATREVARILGQDEFASLTHQGKHASVQLAPVGDRSLVATIYDLASTTPGLVAFHGRDLVASLAPLLRQRVVGREGEDEGPAGVRATLRPGDPPRLPRPPRAAGAP